MNRTKSYILEEPTEWFYIFKNILRLWPRAGFKVKNKRVFYLLKKQDVAHSIVCYNFMISHCYCIFNFNLKTQESPQERYGKVLKRQKNNGYAETLL